MFSFVPFWYWCWHLRVRILFILPYKAYWSLNKESNLIKAQVKSFVFHLRPCLHKHCQLILAFFLLNLLSNRQRERFQPISNLVVGNNRKHHFPKIILGKSLKFLISLKDSCVFSYILFRMPSFGPGLFLLLEEALTTVETWGSRDALLAAQKKLRTRGGDRWAVFGRWGGNSSVCCEKNCMAQWHQTVVQGVGEMAGSTAQQQRTHLPTKYESLVFTQTLQKRQEMRETDRGWVILFGYNGIRVTRNQLTDKAWLLDLNSWVDDWIYVRNEENQRIMDAIWLFTGFSVANGS